MNKIRKTTNGLDCLNVLSEEFVALDDNNVCTAPIMADKDILELVQSSENIIVTNFDEEIEFNIKTPVPMPPEMRNIMKRMRTHIPVVK
ncbi:hypothetical protein TNCV_4795931 [Trichonephila clavipes]|nr:hypothetical protein TNCV_4795931 [Trichonephila clavipes]